MADPHLPDEQDSAEPSSPVLARADALMQRNQSPSERVEGENDFPVLTEVLSPSPAAPWAMDESLPAEPPPTVRMEKQATGEFVLFERNGPVVTLTLNQPDERNALSGPAQWEAVTAACQKIQADPLVAVVILTGAGSTFCTGSNVQDYHDKRGLAAGSPLVVSQNYRQGIQQMARALWTLDTPVIAAVNGPAIGAGFDLACLCDLRIAAESARFSQSFVRMGLTSANGGAWLLQRLIGYAKAAELALTGSMIDAGEAERIGLVSYVVPDHELLATAIELAGRMASNPASALRLTKRLMREAQSSAFETSLELAASFQALAHHSAEHDAAVANVLKRKR